MSQAERVVSLAEGIWDPGWEEEEEVPGGLLCLCSLQLPVNTSRAPSSGLISLPQEVAVGAVSCSGALLNSIPSSNSAQRWLLQALLSTEQHMTTPGSHPRPRSPSR